MNTKTITIETDENKTAMAYQTNSDGTKVIPAECAGPVDWVTEMVKRWYPASPIIYTATLMVTDRHFPGEPALRQEVSGTGFDAAHAIGKEIQKLHDDGFIVLDIGPVASN